jgi:hypothetical protein
MNSGICELDTLKRRAVSTTRARGRTSRFGEKVELKNAYLEEYLVTSKKDLKPMRA